MQLSKNAARFLPLVQNVAAQIQRELFPHLACDSVTKLGLDSLQEAHDQFRSRQGLTLRAYLIYKVRSAVYQTLTHDPSPDVTRHNRYLFFKKANEFLLQFYLSAEGSIKRSVHAEAEEVFHLLKCLTIIAWLTSTRGRCGGLNPEQQDFVRWYYGDDIDLLSISQRIRLSQPAAFRFHHGILQQIAQDFTPHELEDLKEIAKGGVPNLNVLLEAIINLSLSPERMKDFTNSRGLDWKEAITDYVGQDENVSNRISSLFDRLF